MTRKSTRQNLAKNNSSRRNTAYANGHQPFWIPAFGFYILSSTAAIIFFFLFWVILEDGTGDMPWIGSGILASLIIVGAVFLREVIFRRRRYNLLIAQERLDHNLKNIYLHNQNLHNENKLTIEKNEKILKEITQKSEAAKVLEKFSEAHWEVFELCDKYLNRIEKELETIALGSPRLMVLKRSKVKVHDLHKFHLMSWSSAESRSLIQEAELSVTISKKLELSTRALNILDSAIQFYPAEQQLIDSSGAVKDFISTVKISHWIEQAEKAAFKGNYKRALTHYRDALFYLARENESSLERDLIAERINLEIRKLKDVSIKKQKESFGYE